MFFLSLIFKNLTRRPFRTGLTVAAFATAIAAVVSLLGVANGFTESFADIYESHDVDIVVSRQGSADRLSTAVDRSVSEKIATLKGVKKTAGVLLETLSLEEKKAIGIPAMGMDSPSWLLDDYEILDGGSLPKTERSLMLGMQLAKRLEINAGDKVLLFDKTFLVSGIFKSESTWENGSMILPLDELQTLTDRTGQVTYINVVLDSQVNQSQAKALILQIQQLDSKLDALTTSDFVSTDTRMQIATAMAWMTSSIALVIGAIGTLNTMMTSVMERTREIGILRAIGWPRRRVVLMIMLESGVLAILSSLLGCSIAILLTNRLGRSDAARGILSPTISFEIVGQGIMLAIAIGCVGALIPAWRAAKMLPTQAFRES
jgi:putative ABC transport system permease protein